MTNTPDDLKTLGFVIEDVEAEWGPEYKGLYRWLQFNELGELEDAGGMQYSPEEAISSAYMYILSQERRNYKFT